MGLRGYMGMALSWVMGKPNSSEISVVIIKTTILPCCMGGPLPISLNSSLLAKRRGEKGVRVEERGD
jgi:hypothetical protein